MAFGSEHSALAKNGVCGTNNFWGGAIATGEANDLCARVLIGEIQQVRGGCAGE